MAIIVSAERVRELEKALRAVAGDLEEAKRLLSKPRTQKNHLLAADWVSTAILEARKALG